jgi:hypothetical protein
MQATTEMGMEQSHIKGLLELFSDIELTELQVTKAVSKFNDYLVRDLKFLANMVGMLSCAGRNCLFCLGTTEAGNGKGEVRTLANLDEMYRLYNIKLQASIQKGDKTNQLTSLEGACILCSRLTQKIL